MTQESTRTIERAYRVRCYPTKKQARLLAHLFGAKRWVWNWALARKSEAYRLRKEKISTNQISNEFTQLKKTPELAWLNALPREPFIQVLRDLNAAYTNFFAKRARFPRFKKKSYAGTVRFKLDQRRTQVDPAQLRVISDSEIDAERSSVGECSKCEPASEHAPRRAVGSPTPCTDWAYPL